MRLSSISGVAFRALRPAQLCASTFPAKQDAWHSVKRRPGCLESVSETTAAALPERPGFRGCSGGGGAPSAASAWSDGSWACRDYQTITFQYNAAGSTQDWPITLCRWFASAYRNSLWTDGASICAGSDG